MLTDRTQALLAAIEHQIDAGQAALEAERDRVRALEAENRALKERLLALAELDPMVVNGNTHNEDPDGGSRARGLGNLAFRRPRHKPEGDSVKRPLSPLQRLTSSPSALEVAGDHSQAASANNDAGSMPAAESKRETEDASVVPPSPNAGEAPAGDDEPASSEAHGQNSLAFGAEHEAPSPQSLLAQWYKRYPQTFFKGHTRPLKTGIHLDLCEREPWPEKLVRRALACYVHLPRYLKSVREGARRVDLSGADSEIVTGEEAKHAKRQLEALQKKQKARESQKRADQLDRKIGALLAKHGQRQT